jgi:hypothetical protein
MHSRLIAASLALLLPVLAACHEDETLNPPETPPVPAGGPLFQRYVGYVLRSRQISSNMS